ncbi:MAG: carbohydrate ABC transporter permease [Rhodobacteraceae bacterium]|nr:carbohydrate ABC transporter permease [Paracoccaceae bacterium]
MKFLAALPSRMVVLIAILFSAFPIYWIAAMALKSPKEAFAIPPVFAFTPVWENFSRAWEMGGFDASMINSLVITIFVNLVTLAAAIPAAYALSRHEFSGQKIFLVLLLLFYLLPEFLFIIPLYNVFQTLGLFDTRIGLIIAYQVFSLPFAIWLLRGFFAEIPRDIGEAAQLDGCSNFGVLWRMYIPLSVPGIAAVVILNSIRMWNELTYALALTFSTSQTVTLSVASFRGYGQMDWGAMSAGAVISAAPMVLMALFAQRYIVRGLTLGAVK